MIQLSKTNQRNEVSIVAEKKEKQYVSDNARLMAEWNWEKNNELGFDPQKLTCGTNKKAWWKCEKGHEWEATIGSRNSGCRCPYCAGLLVIKGENDLQTVNPIVAEEWDCEKNGDLTPTDVSPYSHKRIWWKCKNGHEWQAAVSKRTIGQNCPFCSGKKAWSGYNDLSITNPELVPEWDFEKNTTSICEYRPMSNKKVWWICDKGHSWEAAIDKRAVGEKCPICQGKKILIGFNDLATTHPLLSKEWDYEKNGEIIPTNVSKGSHTKVWWKCNRNHSWQSAISSRASGIGCPIGSKELQSSFPEKAVYFYIKKIFRDAIANYRSNQLNTFELDIFIPSLQIGVEYDGDRWHRSSKKDLQKNKLCAQMGIVLIRIREPNCPILLDNLSICIHRESKKTGLETTIKTLLEKLSDISNIDFPIDVDLERDNTAILELLTSSEKENSVYLQNPNLLKEWDYEKNGTLSPNMVTTGSGKKVWWTCSLGHSYQAAISSKTKGNGCPICSGKRVLKGFNDFESRCPELVKGWDFTKNDITPDMVAYGSDKKFWWTCDNGHSYQCSINNRRAGQSCPICSNKKILVGFNDINTTHPQLVTEWDYELNPILPTDVSAGSHKKIWWICSTCGHKWIAPIYNRTSGHGCPECAKIKKGPQNKPRADFLTRMTTENPNISFLSEYLGAKEKITCRCLLCGNEWLGTPTNLLRGHGCPTCGNKKAWEKRKKKNT